MQRDLSALGKGFAAGAAATVAMSALMFAGRRAGLLGEMPPEKITRKLLGRAGIRRPTKEEQDALSTAVHVFFGAGAGALFGLVHGRLRPPLPALAGMAYGLLVWAFSYSGWIPALEIMSPPKRDRPGRPQTMIAAHLVYGATLGALLRKPRG